MGNLLANILGGGALDGVSKIIDSIRGKSPEDAAKLAQIQADLQTMQTKYSTEFAEAQINANVALNQTAAGNIQAEAKSTAYAADARPTVIYGGMLIAFINYGVLAVLPPRWAFKPIDIPTTFWEIWCVCVTGYVFARSGDKLFGGAGGSLQLPFGIKAESKGDK